MVFANLTRPGVFVSEDSAGYRIPELASHNHIYMLGSSAAGDIAEPTQVTSLNDFTNQFGSSPSLAAVRALFRNDPSAILYFVRVPIGQSRLITVSGAVAGTETVVLNGTNVSAVIAASPVPTLTSVRDNLINAIALSSVSSTISAVAVGTDKLRVYLRDSSASGLTVTSASANLSITTPTATIPYPNDVVWALEAAFESEEDWGQGYLLAPEFYQQYESADCQVLAAAMEAHCSDKEYDWVSLVDASQATYASTTALSQEASNYNSPQGHSWFYAPWIVDLENTQVPASAYVAGLASRINRTRGFQKPAAGAKYPLKGAIGLSQSFNNQQQSVLNPLGINLIRKLRNGVGIVVWAARTLSPDSGYKFGSTRVVMNTLNGTLREAYKLDLFDLIDGRGALLSRLTETARTVCRQMWNADGLFGDSEDEAFEVKCSFENNPSEQLEQGNVLLDVFVATSPVLEKILVRSYRVPVGQVQSAADGDVSVNN